MLTLARKMPKINILESTFTKCAQNSLKKTNIFIHDKSLILSIFRANTLFHSFSTEKRKWLHFLLGKAKDKQNGEKRSFQFVECDGQNLWKLINDTNQFCEKHCRSILLLSSFFLLHPWLFLSLVTQRRKQMHWLVRSFFLLLHLLLFPSKGKKKNQTYLLSQTLKFLTTVTNHFCSLFSSNLVKQVSTKFLHFFRQKLCGRKTLDLRKSSKTHLLLLWRGEITPKSKEFWSPANAFENNSTFQPNAATAKEKEFRTRWRVTIFSRQRESKKAFS